MKVFRSHLLLCGGTGCHASGSLEVKKALLAELDKRGLAGEIKVVETGCNGFCAMGPVMVVYPEGVMYMMVHVWDIPELVEEHLLKGRVLERLLYKEPVTGEFIPTMQQIPFFALQELRVLRNRGIIDPEKIEEYIARDGYAGVAKALTEMTSEEIIKEVMDSGLRGRGGAGFPTGLKWRFASQSPGDIKYVLCNADEGDPGAFMDRSVLEADPHAVLEGMVIASKAIGAHQGYIYCRAEYPLAIHRLNIAIDQAREAGLLGKDILGTGFDFDLEIYKGAGAFVCGEETALMTSIEGKRGMPRPRPPFPAVAGLWQRPSILNNVETLANIGQIILRGAAWYAGVGSTRSKGTKVFALTGDVNNIGLVEVPLGTPLGTIVFDIGGGIPNGKKFKAAQLGGPSGGMIPIQHLNAPVDYEKVAELGAIMGSGGLIVMNEDSCAVDMARFFMDFCKDESCGKCTPCRAGTQKMLEILMNICNGQGKEGDIQKLEKWANVIKNTALCGLGQTAPNPVLSTLRYFRHEYEAHIRDNRCVAGVCRAHVARHALEDKCLPCLEKVAGYDAGGYEGFKAFLPGLVSERLVACIHNSGCAVDLARFSMMVPARNKSCTKCTTCRIGSAQMLNILNEIATGNGGPGRLDLLFELTDTMKIASDCPVGKTAADIVRFTLDNFSDQFRAHILEKSCPFNVCGEAVSYHDTCPLHADEVVETGR